MPSGTVAAVQNLNKRVEKRKEKKSKVPHQSTVAVTVFVQYIHSECTVSKYSSGIGTFII